jgi:hypothetical protein
MLMRRVAYHYLSDKRCAQSELMQSFFAGASAVVDCDVGTDRDNASKIQRSSCSAAAYLADAGADGASAFQRAMSEGRNAPAAAADACAADAGHPADGAARAWALVNMCDAAQQLGAHSLAAAASRAAAASAAAVSAGARGGCAKADAAAGAAAALARVRRELRRAEAAWSAVDCTGTARAVCVAIASVVPGGASPPPTLSLRFHREAPQMAAAAAAASAAARRGDWLANGSAAGSSRALAAAGLEVNFYHRR